MKRFLVKLMVEIDPSKEVGSSLLVLTADAEYVREKLGDVLDEIDHPAIKVAIRAVKEVRD